LPAQPLIEWRAHSQRLNLDLMLRNEGTTAVTRIEVWVRDRCGKLALRRFIDPSGYQPPWRRPGRQGSARVARCRCSARSTLDPDIDVATLTVEISLEADDGDAQQDRGRRRNGGVRAGGGPDDAATRGTMPGMKAFSFTFALAVGFAGCGASQKNDVPPAPVEPAKGGSAAGTHTCQTDADCVVSCARPQECCDQLCPPCDQAFHKDALAAHEAWRSESCAATSCPVAKCMAPTEDSVARCAAGTCTVERVPHAEQ
jgi:hypothetical protein